MKTFSEQLLAARKARHMTQEQLAEQMNVSRPMISHWETGRSLPDIDTVKRLSQVLNYNFMQDAIADGAEQPKSSDTAESNIVTETDHEQESKIPQRKRRWIIPLLFLVGMTVVVLVVLFIIRPPPPQENPIPPEVTVQMTDIPTDKKPVSGEGSPEWYRQPNERIDGQAYLVIATRENPLKATLSKDHNAGIEWHYTFYMEEVNDIDFTVEEIILSMFYTDTQAAVHRYDAEQVKSWWGTNTVPGGRQQMYSGNISRQNMIGMGIMFVGMDASGNQREFHYYLEFSQELSDTPRMEEALTEDETANAELLALCKQPNERVEGKAYLSVTTDENPLRAIRTDRFASGIGWRYIFYLEEINGIDFAVEELTCALFFTETRADIRKWDAGEVETWWHTNVIQSGHDPYRFNGGMPREDALGVGIVVAGTDAKGNQLEFYSFLEFSQEINEDGFWK